MRAISVTGRHYLTLLLLLAVLAGCSLPGRGTPTPPSGTEPPTEMPVSTDPNQPETPVPASSGAGSPGPGEPTVTLAATAVPPTVAPTPTLPPSNGPLTKYRLVTFYGHPNSSSMGVLGEYDPEPMVARLKQQAAAYTALDPQRPALCTIELIASVAQGAPGPNNLWLLRTSPTTIEKYAKLAEKHGCLLLLDIQMGLDSVANDVQAILPFLQRPYVHLAIDPEFHVKPGQQPGEHYGSVSAAEVLAAAKVLSDLVVQYNIPDKVLVLHQFRDDMLPDKANIKPVAHVQMVVVMDGWGAPAAKVRNYNGYIRDELIQYGGIKLFYQQDDPLLTPEEVLGLFPAPLVIIFQ